MAIQRPGLISPVNIRLVRDAGIGMGMGNWIDIGMPDVIKLISAGFIGSGIISGGLLNSTMTHVIMNRSIHLKKRLSFMGFQVGFKGILCMQFDCHITTDLSLRQVGCENYIYDVL
jgi:hypothetical protein